MILSNYQTSKDDEMYFGKERFIEGVAWHDEYTKWEAHNINEFCKKRGLPIRF